MMKCLLAICTMVLALSGCGGTIVHSIGSPSTGSTPRMVLEAYEDYLGTYEPLYFALSLDGRFFNYTFCTKNCLREVDAEQMALRSCNIYATWTKGRSASNANPTNKCKIFAARGNTRWTDPIEGPIARYLE
jgi:hypothetical protein